MRVNHQMENGVDLKIEDLVKNLYRLLLGVDDETRKRSSIIKVNNNNLSTHGALCFPTCIETWEKVFPKSLEPDSRCRDILEYYLIRNGIDYDDKQIKEKALQSVIRASSDWYIKIAKCVIENKRVSVFLNREQTFADIVSRVLARGGSYGDFGSRNECFYFNVIEDRDSDLTNLRLRLIKGVAENVLKAHGYQISNNINSQNYNITIRSRNNDFENESKVLLCGVVKSMETKAKDTALTEAEYLRERLEGLSKMSNHKRIVSDKQERHNTALFQQIAEAAIALEFLAVRPSRALTISSSLALYKSSINVKGSSFILYNTARISAIFDKFEEECSNGNYPSLPNIENVDFSLLNQEEEWELLYNFLLRYPEMLKSCARLDGNLEICPQYICLFLSHLCNKFSAYYRRVRILTEGRDHLIPTMMARLYLLKAVQIVTCNALMLLNINPVSRM